MALIRDSLLAQEKCSQLEYELTELMLSHNEKEEHILYGKCDQALDEARLVEILLEM